MKKKIATRPLSGFDELDAAGIGAGYRAFEEEQPVAEAPKEKSTSLGDYSNAAGSGVLKGIAGTATGIGTFAQAPAANTLSGVLGARALVDRGVTGVRNWINPGSSALDEDVQSNARMASQFAAEERAKNSADGGIAGAAKSVEGFGRASTQALKDFDENYNPELIKQEKNVSDAKGFWGTAKATLSNPLALTGSLAQSAPDMALGVGVGSLAARSRMALGLGAVEKAGAAAAKTVAASGGDLVAQGVAANAARDAAAQALQKSATHVAGSVGVVSESASSAYGGREGTYQQVMGMPEQTLLKTPRYNAILAATGDPAKARMQFANEIADQAPMLTALGTALGSMAITKITGHDLTAELAAGAKKTTAKDIAVNALGHEGPEEVLQGIPEDLVQHGAMVQADPDHELDLGGGIAQNYIAGAVMGAGGTGASYVKDKFGKQAPVDPAAAAAKLLADQQEAARKAAVGAAHAAAATPNSPISRAAAAANPMTPEEAWAKAQELDAQAALDEANGVTPVIQAPVDVGGSVGDGQGGVNEPAPIDNDPTIKDSLTTQPAFDVQAAQEQYRAETLAAQQAQDDELNAQAEAALAKMAQNKQKTRPVNEVVSDGGYLYEGTQNGDVLNGMGKPFTLKLGALQEAKRQARENGGNWTVAPVFDGYVARKKEASNVGVQDGTEPRSAEPAELAGDNANAGMGDRPVDRLPEGDNPLGADADPLGQSGEQAGGVDAAPVAQTLTEAKRRDYGDGYTGIEYSFGSGGTANVMVKPDGSAYLTDIVLGDSESDSRGKGQGTAAYIELGRQLAEQGVKLESTRWSKHKSAIAPSALRIWQKLEVAGLARQTGVEEGKVYDRFSSNEDEVKSIPVYEFIGNQSNNVQNTAPAANDPEAEAAPNPQHQEQFPPSQAGDILNLQGKPFNTMAGAMLKLKRLGDGHEIVRVDGGLVIRPKAAAPVAAPAQEATETVAPSEVERYQWQRNAEGGQERGNQQTIQPLTEALFNEYIAPKVAVKSYRDYQQQFPAATHISLVQKADGSVELGAGGVGPIEKLRPSAAPVEKGWVKAVDSFDSPEAVAHGSSADSAIQPKPLAGQPIDKDWTAFHPESGTLNVPRADMPQIKSENRGALVNFLKARGISSTQEEVPTESLKPTQREYSPEKVEKAKGFKGNDRSILVSSDGHVLDGHHQWVAKHEAGEPVKVIRLDAPIDALLSAVREFPSAETTVNSTTQEKANEKAPKTEQEPAKQQAATGAEPVNAAEPDQPAAEPAGASPSEVDLTTVEGVARAVQLKVATNRRKSREKSRKEREAKGYAPNSTPESEQADYEAEISAPPSDMQKQSAAAMLGADPLPLIRMFVNGNFEASEDVFKAITGVKIRGLSAAAKKAALYQWAGWTPEQIAQAEGDVQARKDEAAEKYRQDDLKSAVMGAWLGLDRLKVKEKDGTQTTGQDFVLKTVASGFDKAHSQKKGAAVIYGLTDGSRFTTLKAREFTAFVKSAIAFGGLDKALSYVNPPKPQAPEGFVDRSVDTADSKPQRSVEESAQEKSEREYGENYNRVANTDDLSTLPIKDIERASNWASREAGHEKRKGWDGGEVNQNLIAVLDSEIARLDVELKSRRASVEKRQSAEPTPADGAQDEQPDATARISELPDGDIRSVLEAARKYAEKHFANKTVTNKDDGSQILIALSGIKHALSSGAGRLDALAATDLENLIANAKHQKTEADKQGRKEIKAIHRYSATLGVAGDLKQIGIIVREHADGRRYYDHFELRQKDASPLGSSGETSTGISEVLLDQPTGGDAESVPQPTESSKRPKNWETNYGAASKVAEALGIALRGANGKMKKVPELVAEIKVADAEPVVNQELKTPVNGKLGGADKTSRTAGQTESVQGNPSQSNPPSESVLPVTPEVKDQDLETAKALIAEQAKATGNPTLEGRVRKKIRDFARTIQDGSPAALALDIAATRLGMGEGNLKGLEFADKPSNFQSSSPAVQDFIDGKRDDAPTLEEVKAELSPLTKARNFLMELEAKMEAQGRVVDDRLVQMIRQQKAVIKELEAEQGKAQDLPSQEASNTIQSSPSEDAITEAKATIESLDAQIKRHEELLGCLG